jgi:hypothetical protein
MQPTTLMCNTLAQALDATNYPHVQLASIEHYIMQQQQQPYNNFLSKNKVWRILITKGIGEHFWSYVQNLFLELYFR